MMNNVYFGLSIKDGLLESAGWIFAESEDDAKKMISKGDDDFYIFELPPDELDNLILERMMHNGDNN